MATSNRGAETRVVDRVGAQGVTSGQEDLVVSEEPLEMRVAGDTLSVTMRTPGDDRHLMLGFLFAEGIITDLSDVGHLAHCGRPGDEGFGNVMEARPAAGVVLRAPSLDAVRRGTLTTSACGVCGRRSIEDLLARVRALPAEPRYPLSLIQSAPGLLRAHQPNFERTGGIHGAAILDAEGRVLAAAEDVGRHNAVDKVVGELLSRGLIESGPAVLVVSGRVSFEIVQKAAVARIPCLVAVSAPTSLAIDLAERVGMTLAGFARDDRVNLYTHTARVLP